MENYIKETYNVPADIGRKVIVNGKPGLIIKNNSHYLGVNFDSDKPGVISNCHPTWEVTYLDEFAQARQPTKAQLRYQRYLRHDDNFESFIAFCYWDAAQQRKKNC